MKGCLKYGLYAFIGLFVLGLIGQMFTDDESTDLENSSSQVVDNSDNTDKRIAEIQDSIRTLRNATRDSLLSTLSNDRRLRESVDEFKPDYAFYYPKSAPKYNNVAWVFPYIGKAKSQVWLRMKFQYKADDWLFIDKVTALVEDSNGEKEVIQLYSGRDFERDNSGGTIWEYADIAVDDTMYLKLLKINDAKSVKIRYDGSQYYNDRNLTSREKKALSDIIDVYKEIRS